MTVVNLATHTIHALIVLILSGVFIFNLYNGVIGLNSTENSFSILKNSSLVPPAVTLCIDSPNYTFNITIYGVKRNNQDFLTTYTSDSEELANLKDLVTKCWILSAGREPLLQDPPPTNDVYDMVLTYTRPLANQNDLNSPMYLNVFDPLELSSLFQFNRFLYLAADANRVITFSRTQYITGNKTKNDVIYKIVDEYRDPSWTNQSVAVSRIVIRPESFVISQTTEVPIATRRWAIFRESLTLLGVLYSGFYLTVMGQGKFKPWGILHRMLNYYPIEHIRYRGSNDENDRSLISKEAGVSSEPKVEEKLSVYLARFNRAKYHQ
ncbi:8574_t:CDS:2 [Ambispora leptoticha]|uniref:8574_t:CDS:1 n=1 Tax=Ambispora leptoticha TaxID=144679 RepID=A0A9N9B771_9GLOM|nr:8574_t:CDS:2 [Ambispora leptoticha]